MFQQITIIGHLGDAPQMRYTPSGVPVTSFSLAVNRTWVDTNGERQQKAIWFRVSAWRKVAESASARSRRRTPTPTGMATCAPNWK